jgi:hypothetical protein
MSGLGSIRWLLVVAGFGGELDGIWVAELGPVGRLLRWVGLGGAEGRTEMVADRAGRLVDAEMGAAGGIEVIGARGLENGAGLSFGIVCGRGLGGAPAPPTAMTGFLAIAGLGYGLTGLSSNVRACVKGTPSVYRPYPSAIFFVGDGF